MRVPYEHIRHQGPVIAGLGRVALAALAQKVGRGAPPISELPGREITAVVPPRDPAMVADYIRWAKGDVRAWRGRVPPHLFPQWGFPLLGQTLEGIRYPIAKVLNGGCRIEAKAPIPTGTPLHLSARLEDIDDDGRRAVLHQRLRTSLPDGTEALVCDMFAIVPLGGGGGDKPRKKKTRPLVHPDAREVGRRRLTADDGTAFAFLTGDFNPIHWLKPCAAAAGFGRTILHGFGTLAMAIETARKTRWAGDIDWPGTIDVRFTRPLKLPSTARVFVHPHADGPGHDLFVGPAPGAPAWLTGTFTPPTPDSTEI